MYYEINVAKKNEKGQYVHYFATARRSITDRATLKTVVEDFVVRFPEPEFNITISYSPEVSHVMTVENFLENPYKSFK